MPETLTPPQLQRAKATWRRAPQRVWLRRAFFQIHLWVGIAITLYAVLIGLSGSALVFREEIDKFNFGQQLAIPPAPRQTTLHQAIQAIQNARPQWLAVGLEDFHHSNQAPTVLLRPRREPTTNYRMVSFNPNTGQVLLDRTRYSGVLGWLTNLHFYLLAGSTGLLISGYMAAGLLLLCLTGVVLWWPGVRRWAAALVLRRRASWRRLNWDLHSVIGFWSCAALLAVTYTGLYFAFPKAIGNLTVIATGGHPQKEPPDVQPPANKAPVLTIDQALGAARKALPSDAPPGYLQLPSKAGDPYRVTGYYQDTAPYSQLVSLTLDPHTGAVLAHSDTRQQILGLRIVQYFFAVHFGSFGGPGILGIVIKLLWVLLGIVSALLAVTGLLMYWNRKLRPLWARLRVRS